MRMSLLLLAAIVAAALAARASETTSGTIEICRATSVGDRDRDREINVPAGAVFGDSGLATQAGGSGPYWPLWIMTTEPMRIEAARACGTAKARVSSNLDRRRVQRADNRLFIPSAVTHGGVENWPGEFRLTATVAIDFK